MFLIVCYLQIFLLVCIMYYWLKMAQVINGNWLYYQYCSKPFFNDIEILLCFSRFICSFASGCQEIRMPGMSWHPDLKQNADAKRSGCLTCRGIRKQTNENWVGIGMKREDSEIQQKICSPYRKFIRHHRNIY